MYVPFYSEYRRNKAASALERNHQDNMIRIGEAASKAIEGALAELRKTIVEFEKAKDITKRERQDLVALHEGIVAAQDVMTELLRKAHTKRIPFEGPWREFHALFLRGDSDRTSWNRFAELLKKLEIIFARQASLEHEVEMACFRMEPLLERLKVDLGQDHSPYSIIFDLNCILHNWAHFLFEVRRVMGASFTPWELDEFSVLAAEWEGRFDKLQPMKNKEYGFELDAKRVDSLKALFRQIVGNVRKLNDHSAAKAMLIPKVRTGQVKFCKTFEEAVDIICAGYNFKRTSKEDARPDAVLQVDTL